MSQAENNVYLTLNVKHQGKSNEEGHAEDE